VSIFSVDIAQARDQAAITRAQRGGRGGSRAGADIAGVHCRRVWVLRGMGAGMRAMKESAIAQAGGGRAALIGVGWL